MNIPVSFELAKLLKEKGINIWSEYKYTDFNGVERLEKEASGMFPFAPTIAEVVMWLYEKHEIWISVNAEPESGIFYFSVDKNKGDFFYDKGGDYSSPTEAYEAAIEFVLLKKLPR